MYKVYYNEDCQKYGVQKLINDYRGEHWTQIIIYKGKEVAPFTIGNRLGHCYTPYKAVAQRWLNSLTNNTIGSN